MASLRRPVLRFALGLAVALVAILHVQALVQTLRSQARVRERVVRTTRDAILTARPRLQTLLREGGDAGFRAAAEEAISTSLASEFEIFEIAGKRLYSFPATAPVSHWPGDADLGAIRGGQVVTLGPLAGEAPRLLTYAPFRAAGTQLVARFSVPVSDVVEDLRERRELLAGHAVSLAILVLAVALLVYPRAAEVAALPPRALHAYEQAMGRLRDQGEERSREHEAERRELRERLEASAPMARAGELTAGMAHEVRNGLGTILGYARLLERGVAPDAASEAARSIREECEALENVVRRFVDFVKDETLHVAPFDLRRTLSRVAARESRGPGADVILEAGPGVVLHGDEELLERAFENLVRNGREAAGPGGHVWISAEGAEPLVRVRVSDDGPGLSAEARASLRPFLTTKPGGLGLGLPIVYKIVGLHRGEILIGDRLPRGLAVSVGLPRLVAPDVTGGSSPGLSRAFEKNR